MQPLFKTLVFLVVWPMLACAAQQTNAPAPRVELQTNMGNIVIELDPQHAPVTVDNFLTYVKEGHYNGTVFHRVIENFMIQGGGYTEDYEKRKSTHGPIHNEADNGLLNNRGSIAMARTGDPHSATAQFFINVVDNPFLNFKSKTRSGWGYTVFGKVVSGMDVVDRIKAMPTGHGGPFPKDVPQNPVIIEQVTVLEQTAPATTAVPAQRPEASAAAVPAAKPDTGTTQPPPK